jgi:hypothetical protein
MLAGAVNTAIIGSNGVLNRVSEDGVLTNWFRAPQRKYGTSYRIINLVVLLQIATILASRGDIFLLGEAYAFGVIWSFTFNSIATAVLRFKRPENREWKVPLNIRFGRLEIPVGLILISSVLLAVALTNVVTKKYATMAGLGFTGAFFVLFTVSELIARRRLDRTMAALDQFQLQHHETANQAAVGVRPGSVLVAVRDYNSLLQLEHALRSTDTDEQDIVVMTVRLLHGPDAGERELHDSSLFTDHEQRLFSKVVGLAEKHGKEVNLVVVPSTNVFDAIAQTALLLDSSEIVAALSAKMSTQEQAGQLGRAWERLTPKPRRQVKLRIVGPVDREETIYLGAHPPQLTEDDIGLIHQIWLEVAKVPARRKVHHRDVVRVALERLRRDIRGQTDVMLDFYRLEHNGGKDERPGPRTRAKDDSDASSKR